MRKFFLILLYFYMTSSLLMIKLFKGKSIQYVFEKTYVLTLFGGLSSEDFNEYPFAAISIIFGTLMITIVLLNILIAYLSNLFSRLEDCQLINDYKEKASMALDLEVMLYFFCCRFRKVKETQQKSEDKEDPDEEILYIFKPIDYKDLIDQDQIDDNIYKKLKMLIKDISHIKMNLKKRDEKIDEKISAFVSLLKKHSEVMDKIESSSKSQTKSFLNY
jgi:hypothetical protein